MPGKVQKQVERLPLLTGRPILAALGALAIAGAGLAMRLLANPVMPSGYPYVTFFPMVVIASLLLGWRNGTIAAVASGLAAWYFFITPERSFHFDGGVAMALTFYAFVVVTDILLIHWLQVFIATAAMEFPNSFLDKYQWLQRHFPFIEWRNFVFCGDKSILNADYLIDDNAYNFDGFRGQGLLFDAPHNALETRYRRVHSWQEVGELLL